MIYVITNSFTANNFKIYELKLKIKKLRVEIASIDKDKLQSILDDLDDKV